MAWKEVTIDDSILNFGDGIVRVAEGDYLSAVLKVVPSPATLDYDEQDPYLEFSYKLIDGPDGLGKTLRRRCWVSPKGEDGRGGSWGLGQTLDALGADPSSLVNIKFPTYQHFAKFAESLSAKLSGANVGLEVADDTYTSSRSNKTELVSRIMRYFPAQEWELRSKPRTTPSAAPTAAPTPPKAQPAANGTAANGTAASAPSGAPTPASAASPAGGVVVESMDENNLDAEIKKLFAATSA